MTATIHITAPCALINANHRLHYHAKASRTLAWRKAAETAAEAAEPLTIPDRARIVIHIHTTTRRTYDAGNLHPTGKAIIDGFTDAGLWPDDSNQYVIGPDMRQGEKQATLAVTVTITEPEAWETP